MVVKMLIYDDIKQKEQMLKDIEKRIHGYELRIDDHLKAIGFAYVFKGIFDKRNYTLLDLTLGSYYQKFTDMYHYEKWSSLWIWKSDIRKYFKKLTDLYYQKEKIELELKKLKEEKDTIEYICGKKLDDSEKTERCDV